MARLLPLEGDVLEDAFSVLQLLSSPPTSAGNAIQ